MRRSSSFVLSLVALTFAGCGSDDSNPGPVVEADAVADVAADTTVTPNDTGSDDTATGDTTAADTTTADTTTADTKPVDGNTVDSTVSDLGTDTSDTSVADTTTSDTFVSDTRDAASDTADVSVDANLPALPNAEIWVSRVGDGTSALVSGEAAAAFVVRYKLPERTVVGTLALPTAAAAANKRFTFSGTATSEGHLLRSANGAYVTMIGYDAAPATPSVLTAATARTIARIDKDGVIDTSTTTTSYAGVVVRSAITNDGGQYWLTGDASSGALGVSYLAAHGGSGAATGLSTGFDSLRVINIFGGALWGTGGQIRIWSFGSTLPTTASAPTSVTSAADGSAYGIVGFDLDAGVAGIDTLYVCDDRAIASGGGVRRWKKGSGTPPFATVTQLSGGLGIGCRGLSGMVVGGDVVLFVVTGESPSRVGVMIDIGGAAATATFDPIATAATSSHFRGVALKPE